MAQDKSVAQTLSRGRRLLEALADAPGALSVQQLADQFGVSQPIVYRLLHTLELHGLVRPGDSDGTFDIALGLLTLGRKIVRDLWDAAFPELQKLTHDHSATSYVGIREGEEIVCVLSCEPESHALAIRHREGMRVPLRGASSWAILSADSPSTAEGPEVTATRRDGFAVSEGSVFPGALAVSAPIHRAAGRNASLTLVFGAPDQADRDRAVADVVAAAERISSTYTL